ncbi:hypothetical protein HMPREF9554_01989 [Treponema phagedenis F0421]|nr:hypothetical protein HMPREF9554_01989 [Treponema phagedenis F0421]
MSFFRLLFSTDKTHFCLEPPPSVAVLLIVFMFPMRLFFWRNHCACLTLSAVYLK